MEEIIKRILENHSGNIKQIGYGMGSYNLKEEKIFERKISRWRYYFKWMLLGFPKRIGSSKCFVSFKPKGLKSDIK